MSRIRSLVIPLVLLIGFPVARADDAVESKKSFLPDTGQTLRYTPTYGEDADYIGDEPNFTENNDGTVTDRVTGLTWQKTDGGEMTWEQAQAYARSCQLAGHSDWRLPTSIELFSIMNHGKHGPAMDTGFFPKTDARYWWSDAVSVDDPSKVWVVNSGGGIGAHRKSETYSAGGDRPIHVRCVRGDSTLGAGPVLVDNADGTVTDKRTGLIWQQIGREQPLSWDQAVGYCDRLELAGRDDWRLPNIKELRSLSDDRRSNPSLDPAFFPSSTSDFYWSSTSQGNRPERAWYVDLTTGLVTYADKTERFRLLAVTDDRSTAGTRDKSNIRPPDEARQPPPTGRRRPEAGQAGGGQGRPNDRGDRPRRTVQRP